jgi:hypothetical protein
VAESREQTPPNYPDPHGYYSAVSGKREPWIRCAYCNTHCIERPNIEQPVCDCGKTFWTSNGGMGVNLR